MPEVNFVPNNEQPEKPKSKGVGEESKTKWTIPEIDDNNQTKKFDVLSFFKSVLGKNNEGDEEKKRDKDIISEQQNNVKKEKTAKKEDINKTGENGLADGNVVENKAKLSSMEAVKNKVGLGGAKWKAANIIKTNLIKGEVTTFFNWKKNLIKLGISLGWVFVLLGVVYIGLVVKEKNLEKKGYDIAQEIELLNVTIKSYEKDKEGIDVFKRKVDLVSGLLNDHVYWTNIFTFFEKHTLPGVKYLDTSISGSADGVFSFSAKTDNYESMVNQIKVFQSLDEVKEVDFSGGTRNIEEIKNEKTGIISRNIDVTFDLNITIDKKVFNK